MKAPDSPWSPRRRRDTNSLSARPGPHPDGSILRRSWRAVFNGWWIYSPPPHLPIGSSLRYYSDRAHTLPLILTISSLSLVDTLFGTSFGTFFDTPINHTDPHFPHTLFPTGKEKQRIRSQHDGTTTSIGSVLFLGQFRPTHTRDCCLWLRGVAVGDAQSRMDVR